MYDFIDELWLFYCSIWDIWTLFEYESGPTISSDFPKKWNVFGTFKIVFQVFLRQSVFVLIKALRSRYLSYWILSFNVTLRWKCVKYLLMNFRLIIVQVSLFITVSARNMRTGTVTARQLYIPRETKQMFNSNRCVKFDNII